MLVSILKGSRSDWGRLFVCVALSMTILDGARSAPVRSLLEIRSEGVVLQGWDSSCGAAALTTVLRYHHGLDLDESEVAASMLSSGNADMIRRNEGFSFLDLANYTKSWGFRPLGLSGVKTDEIAKYPFAIVPVLEHGKIPHFIVVRGVTAQGYFDVADPAFGNRLISVDTLRDIWVDGLLLSIAR